VTAAVSLDGSSRSEVAAARPKRDWAAPLLVGVVVLGLGLALIDALPVGGMFDDAMYVILAKSIASGQGLRWLNLPGAPVATHFPPGYPALLAVLWTWFPRFPANVLAFKAANAVLLGAAAAGTLVFARNRLGFSRAAAVALTLAGAVAVPVLYLSTQVLSEPLFLALLLPALLMAERVAERDARVVDVAALGMFIGLVTLVRSQGIAIIGALGLVLLMRRRVRDAVVFGGAALATMLPWQLWVRAHPYAPSTVVGGNYQPYVTWLIDGYRNGGPAVAWSTLAGTWREVRGMVAVYTAMSTPHWMRLAAATAVLLFAIAGVRSFWRRAPVTTVFLLAYVAIVFLWPWAPARFIWGVWPLVILLIAAAVADVAAARPSAPVWRAARVVALACAALLAVGYVRVNAIGYRHRWWTSIPATNARALRSVILWTRDRASPSAVIATSMEPAVYLYTGRQAIPSAKFIVRDFFRPPGVSESADDLRAILSTYHVDAVALITADSLRTAIQSMAAGRSPELVPGDSLDDGRIYLPARR
jgi:hypothetical protein